MKDPYKALGVAKTATEKEIKAAYRKLAKSSHPDLHPGDKDAEARFRDISAAYAIVGDKDQRKRFDAGEIDASGAEAAPAGGFYRDYADAGAGAGARAGPGGGGFSHEGFASAEDLEDLLNQAFGGAYGGGGRGRADGAGGGGFKMRGRDAQFGLQVDFLEAVNGAQKTISLPQDSGPEGKPLKVKIPEGAVDGQTLRLKGKGGPGLGGGPAGDAYIEIHVAPHKHFRRAGDDIHVTVPVTLKEAVLGAKIQVPTVKGPVTLTVPKGSNAGDTLRLRGRGARNLKSGTPGHQIVTLRVVLPEGEEPELASFLEDWTPAHDADPRKEMLR